MEHFYQNIGENWFTYPELYSDMVKKYKKGNFLELGSWEGRSASYLAVEIINSNNKIKLYCVDTWKGSEEHASHDEIVNNTLYETFLKNIDPVKHIIKPIKNTSVEAAKKFKNDFFDFIFIDAAHDYESVYNDLRVWYPKVKKGGFFAGHDYPTWEGVTRAVDEWLYENNFTLEIAGGDSHVWGLTKQ